MDTTYITMRRGFVYLSAVLDWATRRVLAWRLSNSLTADPCVDTLEEAIMKYGRPELCASSCANMLIRYLVDVLALWVTRRA